MFKAIKTALLVVGLALCAMALVELLHAYVVLRELHPWAGATFLVVLVIGLLASIGWYMVSLQTSPPLLLPPAVGPLESAPPPALRRYGRYLLRLSRRLSINSHITEDVRELLGERGLALRAALDPKGDAVVCREGIEGFEKEALSPAVQQLDEHAEKEIRRCVRDVMAGVTLSPWRSVDLLVVIYRNLQMVRRVTRIYNSRPRVREQWKILYDVAAVVATVNFLNYGSRLLQNLTASVPFLGRFSDDIAQGLGAGLLTSVAGHATLYRCSAYHGWNSEAAEMTIRRKLKFFAGDVKGLLTDDILPLLRKPVEAMADSDIDSPELLDRVKEGISKAVDDTVDVMDLFVRKPVAVAGKGVATTGSVLWKGGELAVDGVKTTAKGAWRLTRGTTGLLVRGATAAGRGSKKLFHRIPRPRRRG
jgi:hypothetical protein